MGESSQGAHGAGPSQRAVEIGVAIAMGIFAIVIVIGSLRAGINWGAEGPKAGFFPFYVGLVILGASLFNLTRVLIDRGSSNLFAEWGQLRQVYSVVIPTAIYVALVPYAGIYVASMLLIAFFMRWFGGYGFALTSAIALGTPVAFFLVFEKWFLVALPKGPIENSLGL